jgi:hypothetical protein
MALETTTNNQEDNTCFEGQVVEFSLLLPDRQANALEAIARQQGFTTGQMVRRLIRDFLAQPANRRPIQHASWM